jgi:hypothetical protein
MTTFIVTAVIAFWGGFFVAGVLAAGRRYDTARAGDVLAEAVEIFTAEEERRLADTVDIAERRRLEPLRRALAMHDQLHSA